MKYKKKNPFVEAFKYEGKIEDDNGNYCVPEWLVEFLKIGEVANGELFMEGDRLVFEDEDGDYDYIYENDYIIKEGRRISVLPADVFGMIYEKVEE